MNKAEKKELILRLIEAKPSAPIDCIITEVRALESYLEELNCGPWNLRRGDRSRPYEQLSDQD